jgi:hypothetical protein
MPPQGGVSVSGDAKSDLDAGLEDLGRMLGAKPAPAAPASVAGAAAAQGTKPAAQVAAWKLKQAKYRARPNATKVPKDSILRVNMGKRKNRNRWRAGACRISSRLRA